MDSTRREPPSSESILPSEGDLPPEEAFALLGNETRIAILLVLEGADDPVAYSEIKRAVGVRDSGRFHYHLEKLLGHFVERTEGGYRLGAVGARAAQAVLAGTFASRRRLASSS